MPPLQTVLLAEAAAIAALLFTVWLSSLYFRDASLVDRFWGFGFVVAAWTAWLFSDGYDPRRYLLVAMVTIWGLRLTIYLTKRNWGQGEDYRYKAMRRRRGDNFPIVSLFTVFGLQGVLMWMVGLPIALALISAEPDTLTPLDNVGVAFWLIGFAFEAIGDWQLTRFKANPANQGQVMDRGLWRYTRHPNYFGDFMVWWGLYLIAVAGGAWWTFFGPLVMTVLLMRVSGAGLLEKTIVDRRPGYAEYIETTNAFFPGPPRKRST